MQIGRGTTNGEMPFRPAERVVYRGEVLEVLDNYGNGRGKVRYPDGGEVEDFQWSGFEEVRRLADGAPMSTEHSTGGAVGPYTHKGSAAFGRVFIRDAAGGLIAEVRGTPESEPVATANALTASWDLRAACEAAIRNAERWDDLDADSLAILAQMRAAVAKSYGLRPCDDPALVPEVLHAQPQCVHGLRVMDGRTCCPLHADAGVSLERHEGDRDHGALSWYTYVCDGYLEEKGREG